MPIQIRTKDVYKRQVSLHQESDSILLSVRDDGIGIPADKIDKIWQRFYQVDNVRGHNHGTGLGLAMVRQIAELHNGTMTVESIEGIGSCFTLRFPACLPSDGEE